METYINSGNLKEKTKNWLSQIDEFNTHKLRINPSKAALLVIDMQNYFLNPESYEFTPSGLVIKDNVKSILKACRIANVPVIFTRHAHHESGSDAGIMKWWWKGMCIESSKESEVIDELLPQANERVIVKRRYSAFYNTELDTILRCMNVEEVIICGIMTNMCCESTARDAYYRDYKVFFLADATGSVNEEMHLASLMNLAFGFAYITDTDSIIGELI